MQPGSHPVGGPPSFTARKSAASTLPSFELPPPQISNVNEAKYHPFNSPGGAGLTGSGSVASVGNLLTPPNTIPGDGLSPTSATAFANASQANHLAYSQNGFWPSSAQASNPSPSQYQAGARSQQWIPPSGMFSPSSMNSMARSLELAQPQRNGSMGSPNDPFQQLPPFNSMSMSAPVNLPAVPMNPPQQPMNSGMLHQQMSNSSQLSPMANQDPFIRLPPTPTYSNQPTSASSPQPNSFSPSSGSTTSSTPMRPPTASSHGHMSSGHNSFDMGPPMGSQQQTQQQYPPRSYSQYNLPAVNGPVMTNMHAPSTNMALVGGLPSNVMPPFTSGHAANLMYGAHNQHPAQGPMSDRPFKCDQCMQSFNRNHDLKRHKRIHLAVKPYPCNHCDKSFSRKDALKVSIVLNLPVDGQTY